MKTVKINGYELAIEHVQIVRLMDAYETLDDLKAKFTRLVDESKDKERAYKFFLKFERKLAKLEEQFDKQLEFYEHEIF